MIAAWMVYTVVVSGLVAVGARGLEEGARLAGVPTRLVWAAALLAVVVLGALGPLRPALADEALADGWRGARVAEGVGAGAAEAAPEARDGGPVAAALDRLRGALSWPARAVAAASGPGGRAGGVLAAVWLTLVAGVLGVGVATRARYRSVRRAWPLREMAGVRVRVAPAAGPAVLGLVRPEIVVPAWLEATSPEEQRLVVLHEREHVRAGDGWTLAAGWLAAALVPWNPLAWWMLARLRLAVELDCDARVLRHDVPRRAYGSLLIDLAGRGSGLSLGVPALAGVPSTLERRLLSMTQTSYSRTASFRAAALGALGALALLTACEARMPTSAEIDDMDVASAEARTQELGWVDPGLETATYYLDGVEVTPEQARAQKAEGLARVEIVRGATAGPEIRLTSREASDARADGTSATGAPAQGAPAEPAASAAPAGRVSAVPAAGFDGLVFIDGEEATAEELRELAPSEIARVEVIKGAAAAGVSDDPRAAKGIIRLTTKAASPQG